MKIKHAISILVAVLLVLSIFAYDVSHKTVVVRYTVVAATPAYKTINRGRHTTENRSIWVWSIENEKTKIRKDQEVSFSDYSEFPVGSKVQFTEFTELTAMDNFVIIARFLLGMIMFVCVIFCLV